MKSSALEGPSLCGCLSSRTDLDDDVVDVTSFSARRRHVEIKKLFAWLLDCHVYWVHPFLPLKLSYLFTPSSLILFVAPFYTRPLSFFSSLLSDPVLSHSFRRSSLPPVLLSHSFRRSSSFVCNVLFSYHSVEP